MHARSRFSNKPRPAQNARRIVLAVGLGCSLAGAWHCSLIFANRVVSLLALEHVRRCSRSVMCGRHQGSVPGGGGEASMAANGIGNVDRRSFKGLRMQGSGRHGIMICCGAAGADERDGTEGGEYNVGNGGDQEYDSGFYYDVPVGLEDGNNDQPQLDDGRDVDTYENDYDHLTEHGGSNDGQHQNIDDRGGGEGNDDEEEGDGDGDGDILRSSAELVDALVEGEADISESLQGHSLALEDGDKVVGKIARPVLSYYKRYKAPRVKFAERQEARQLAEKDPFYSAFDCKGSDDGAKSGVDIMSRYGRVSEKPPEGYDEQGPIFEGMPRPEPNVFSKKAQRAQERWRDPVYREEQLSKRKKPYAPRKPESMKPVQMRLKQGLTAPPETVVTVDDVDDFLTNNKITAEEAVRFHSVAVESEERRIRGIFARHKLQTWVQDRLAKGKTTRAKLSDPVFYEDRKGSRSLKAKKAYEVRRRNGNGGYRPSCPIYRARMARRAEVDAVAAAELACGFMQHKRSPGRPFTYAGPTEGVAETLKAWMAAAAVKAAQESGLSNPSSSDPRTDIAYIAFLSLFRTRDLLLAAAAEEGAARRAWLGPGATPHLRTKEDMGRALALRRWTVDLNRIAVTGVEAWRRAWEKTIADAAASAAAADIDAAAEMVVGGSGEGNLVIEGVGANAVLDSTPRRRRGRPFKVRAATQVPTAETSNSSVEMAVASGTTAMPRRRGRPRKIRTADN